MVCFFVQIQVTVQTLIPNNHFFAVAIAESCRSSSNMRRVVLIEGSSAVLYYISSIISRSKVRL